MKLENIKVGMKVKVKKSASRDIMQDSFGTLKGTVQEIVRVSNHYVEITAPPTGYEGRWWIDPVCLKKVKESE